MSCPSCGLPKPAEWCWDNNYTCPLGYPPRRVEVRDLLQLIRMQHALIRMLDERVTALEKLLVLD